MANIGNVTKLAFHSLFRGTASCSAGEAQLRALGPAMISAPARASFEHLAIPLLPSLLNHAFWLTRNQAEAEDLAQEALAKALRAFDSFAEGTNFKAWIFRILRNTFLTTRTGITTARTSFIADYDELEDTLSAGSTPEQLVIQLNDASHVQAALEELSPPLRECLLLCDVEELKYKEIASVLDVPIGTVMSRVSRARAALRDALQAQWRKPN